MPNYWDDHRRRLSRFVPSVSKGNEPTSRKPSLNKQGGPFVVPCGLIVHFRAWTL